MTNKSLQVVVADDEPITRMDLKEYLQCEGYLVVAEAADGIDAIEACKAHRPDLVLMDIKMPLLDGISCAQIITEENYADTVVLITAYSEFDMIEKAKAAGVSSYLVKPIDEKSLIPTIEMAVARSRYIKQLRQDVHKMSMRLEDRKVIEKAKGLVMAREKKSEQEAYDYIRMISLNKCISMRRVAELILMKEVS